MKKSLVFLIVAAAANIFIPGRTLPHSPGKMVNERSARGSSVSENFVRVVRVIDGDTIDVMTYLTSLGQAHSTRLTGSSRTGPKQTAGSARVERVRYIGMDAPETVDPRRPVQCFGIEASKRNKGLVEGKFVRLEKDVSDRDAYGRFLRYVYLEDLSGGNGLSTETGARPEEISVNLELVREGYARAFTYPPDVKYADQFVAAENMARAKNLGFWGACPVYGSGSGG